MIAWLTSSRLHRPNLLLHSFMATLTYRPPPLESPRRLLLASFSGRVDTVHLLLSHTVSRRGHIEAHGKFRLWSRHHVSNLVVRPVEDCPGVVVGVYYLLNFRNPDSDCEAPYLT